jgi:hypothetical protein
MRRRLPLLVFVALAAMAAVAFAQMTREPQARAVAVAATGSFEISSPDDGRPIFAASGLAPGGSTTGTVAIEDTGSEPLSLTLRRDELVDEPGLGGGLLSNHLLLTVVDVTRPAAPRTIYEGPLDSMPEEPAGTLAAGETRTYEFTATLPEGGEPIIQNSVQGASTTVAYSWVANQAEEEEAGGGGTPPAEERRAPEAPTDGGERTEGNGGVRGEVALLNLTVAKIKASIRRGRLTAWTNCSLTCRLSIRGRVRARSATTGTHRVARLRWASRSADAPGPHRVLVRIPPSMRVWIRTTPGPERLRARLRFTAVGLDAERVVARKVVKLRPRD